MAHALNNYMENTINTPFVSSESIIQISYLKAKLDTVLSPEYIMTSVNPTNFSVKLPDFSNVPNFADLDLVRKSLGHFHTMEFLQDYADFKMKMAESSLLLNSVDLTLLSAFTLN